MNIINNYVHYTVTTQMRVTKKYEKRKTIDYYT